MKSGRRDCSASGRRISGTIHDRADRLRARGREKAYAEKAGKARTTLTDKVKAWRVLSVTHMRHDTMRDAAYMQLVLCNTQSELHPLEEGIHALKASKVFTEYAKETGKSKDCIRLRVIAAEVLEHATHVAFLLLRICVTTMPRINGATSPKSTPPLNGFGAHWLLR